MPTATPSRHRSRLGSAPLLVVAALALTAGPSAAARVAAAKTVVTPGQVDEIVAADTALNNKANGSLSITVQDSHESCLQDVLDDATYRGEAATGATTLGAAFNQVPVHAFVPRQSSYPAFFSVLATDHQTSEPTTTNLLTYVKTASSAAWKLSSSTQILGPTEAGVAVPAVATDAQGFATSLGANGTDGLSLAPGQVAGRIAAAFTSEAATGKLPSGISAEFGPKNVADPHAVAAAYAALGTVTTTFSTAVPALAAAGRPSADCPYPAYRLKDGGALVTFAIFSEVHIKVPAGELVVQPANRSALGILLAPGEYSTITVSTGDMGVAIVPPAGSKSPIQVIGQASEGLSETGTSASGSTPGTVAPGSASTGGPANAAALAKAVDPAVVDVNVTLGYEHVSGAGTGMVLTSNGEVLTNNHVIDGATAISVVDVGNGKTYDAKVLGYDRTSDVALLQLEGASGLKTVPTAATPPLRVGAGVVAVGNAGGAGGTPSYAGGKVTAVDQSITASDSADGTSEQLSGLIETNADIQLGDSGGPLVNVNGKVVGMDTAASSSFVFAGGASPTTQGYSIPIGTALSVARQVAAGKSSATVHVGPTAFLGISTISTNSGFNGNGHPIAPPNVSGAVVESVMAGGPAAKAGIVAGDTITSFDHQPVSSTNALTDAIAKLKPSAVVSITYVDAYGAKHTTTAHLGSGPAQ